MNISARGNFAHDLAQLKNPEHQQMIVEVAIALTHTTSITYKVVKEGEMVILGYAHDHGTHGEDW